MGSGYSYLKINVNDCTAGFIFYHNEKYRKIVISCCGNEKNTYNNSSITTQKQYNSYGKWYYYDGKSANLYRVLTKCVSTKGVSTGAVHTGAYKV